MYQFGETELEMDLTFINVPGITQYDVSHPSHIKLYRRNSNSDTGWSLHDVCSNVQVSGDLNEVVFENVTNYGQFILVRNVELIDIELECIVLLEGPYAESRSMSKDLNPELIPHSQPFNMPPWNYSGTETFTENSNVTDWVLVEFRDASNPDSATSETIIKQQACLLLYNGEIHVAANKKGAPVFHDIKLFDSLFLVIHHRNHLPVLSNALNTDNSLCFYDFTGDQNQAYGGKQSILHDGYFGMIASDINADGMV